ncbi:hypothetical protein [Blastococcus xanthinilyticus]|uniref:Uncharacterized protein n=1 Tax=Blastococcus xanthinilyticus TaxID=1564164 RepID=A0A5S5CRW3_9ACTN|nr:hypothetical protein [Blastococcus xanthinilyticus]TYP86490.1 hypothetical protein BD833_10993 [Blastococcus xanthinilyticus]
MNDLTLLRDAGPDAPALSAATRSAARAALLAEIDGPAPRRRRVPGRKATLRIGLAAVTAAAAWAAAVVVTGADGPGPVPTGTGGMTLVAVEEITFPLSLDPVPAGMTPSFTGAAGSDEAVAGYSFPDGTGFSVHLAPEEPAWAFQQHEAADVTGTGTTTVAGVEARYVVGSTDRLCTIVNECFEDLPFAQLVWERAPGEWVYLAGEKVHGDLAALVAVGESLVDRPQPINLQVGLAPAGWSVVDWHESSGAIGVAADDDPTQVLGVQCMAEARPGSGMDNGSAEQRIDSVTAIDPPVDTEIDGAPARIVHAHDHMDEANRFWLVAWELPDGTLCTVHAPQGFAQDDVLAIAAGVTYTP